MVKPLSDAVIEKLVDMRASGKTPAKIEEEMGIDAALVAYHVRNYLEDNYNTQSYIEQRMLQARRIEIIINSLWKQVTEAGDFITEGKQTQNLLNAVNLLTDLLDLRRDRLREEQVELTRAQTELVQTVLAGVRLKLWESISAAVQRIPAEGDPEELKSIVLKSIESGLPQWYANAADAALEETPTVTVQLDDSEEKN